MDQEIRAAFMADNTDDRSISDAVAKVRSSVLLRPLLVDNPA